MKTWILPPDTNLPEWAQSIAGGYPVIAQTLIRRGIDTPEAARCFLDAEAYTPAPPDDLPDMARAVWRIETAIENKERILIWGDFDVDGQTATAILSSALKRLGANVEYYIPNRVTEGHGIDLARLASWLDYGIRLVVTCDTGIAEHDAVNYARSRGVDVVITDHHQLPPELPAAFAAVNPQRLPADHPLYTLPGVGCAYKLIEALYARAGRAEQTAQFLDLVALGIVADVAVQTGDTRYLLQRGLEVLRQTARLGLQAMYELTDIAPAWLDEETIGFYIAPRLNAVGRLADANVCVEFLTTKDIETARRLANQLEGLNNQRKLDTDSVTSAAVALIEADPKLLEAAALVVSKSGWPNGIVGIVANRLVDRYNRPAFVLSEDADGNAHGSARSVAGCNITAAIQRVADENPGLLNGFGGHTMAAGVNLRTENVPLFRRALGRVVGEMLGAVDTTPTLRVDAILPLDALTLDFAHALRQLAPFGPGNPALTFATPKVTLRAHREIGRGGKHIRLTVEDEAGGVQDILLWNADMSALPKGRFDIAYAVGISEYQGQQSVQVVALDFRPIDESPVEFTHRASVNHRDFRALSADQQRRAVQTLKPDVLIWNEGEALPVSSVRRDQLVRAERLAIWTCPPSADVLRAALQAVNPSEVFLFGETPGTDAMNAFLNRMAGVVARVLKMYDGDAEWQTIAGVMGHRVETVRVGMEYLKGRGNISVMYDDEERVRIQPGGDKDDTQSHEATKRLMALLSETKAYRSYFRRASVDALLALK